MLNGMLVALMVNSSKYTESSELDDRVFYTNINNPILRSSDCKWFKCIRFESNVNIDNIQKITITIGARDMSIPYDFFVCCNLVKKVNNILPSIYHSNYF